MYSIRLLTTEDYPELCRWWRFFRFPPPPIECLPDNGTCGIMVSKGGVDICAGFLYFTNSALAWIEYIVSNPDYRNKDRKLAIQHLITEISELAKKRNKMVLFTSVKNQHLIKHFEACGYINSGNNTTEMVKLL